jgi:ribosomal protein S18 acetylase RimI-like enzyme
VDVLLREETAADSALLLQLYASTREEELDQLPWPQEAKEAFLRQQFEAQTAHYHEHFSNDSFQIIEIDGEPAGRLYVGRWEREFRIIDIALLPTFRGGGVGTGLLGALLHEADLAGLPVSIHVEANNPAKRLYVRLGFAMVEDKGIYHLMERPPLCAQVKTAS